MWYFTPIGFYSVVQFGAFSAPDPFMMIRSRDRTHLERLQQAFPRELALSPILDTPERDYPFRLLCTKAEWIMVASGLAARIDYPNFKDEAAVVSGGQDSRYMDAVHEVWSTVWDAYKDTRPPVESA